MQKIALARMSRTLATLVAAGVDIIKALEIAGTTAGNWVLEQSLANVRERVHEGVPIGEPLSLRNAEQVGDVPELLRLLAERLDEVRMRVTERVHRHAGREIEIALAVRRDEPSAVTPLEGEIGARVGGQEMRGHDPSNASGVPK